MSRLARDRPIEVASSSPQPPRSSSAHRGKFRSRSAPLESAKPAALKPPARSFSACPGLLPWGRHRPVGGAGSSGLQYAGAGFGPRSTVGAARAAAGHGGPGG